MKSIAYAIIPAWRIALPLSIRRTQIGGLPGSRRFPGANTQGATLDEARENLKETVSMVLEANHELAEL